MAFRTSLCRGIRVGVVRPCFLLYWAPRTMSGTQNIVMVCVCGGGAYMCVCTCAVGVWWEYMCVPMYGRGVVGMYLCMCVHMPMCGGGACMYYTCVYVCVGLVWWGCGGGICVYVCVAMCGGGACMYTCVCVCVAMCGGGTCMYTCVYVCVPMCGGGACMHTCMHMLKHADESHGSLQVSRLRNPQPCFLRQGPHWGLRLTEQAGLTGQ